MRTLLHISASSRTAQSHSRRLGQCAVERLLSAHPALTLCHRDLTRPALPHLDETFVEASLRTPLERNAQDHESLALSERLIAEMEAAEVIVIDFPMYNFTLPSGLKVWVDHVLRPNRTFRANPTGKTGLLADRPTLCIMAAGGRLDGPGAQPDFATSYLRLAMKTAGIQSIQFFIADRTRHTESGRAETTDQNFDCWIEGLLQTVNSHHAPHP